MKTGTATSLKQSMEANYVGIIHFLFWIVMLAADAAMLAHGGDAAPTPTTTRPSSEQERQHRLYQNPHQFGFRPCDNSVPPATALQQLLLRIQQQHQQYPGNGRVCAGITTYFYPGYLSGSDVPQFGIPWNKFRILIYVLGLYFNRLAWPFCARSSPATPQVRADAASDNKRFKGSSAGVIGAAAFR